MSSVWFHLPACSIPPNHQGPVEVVLRNGKHDAYAGSGYANWTQKGGDRDIVKFRLITRLEFDAFFANNSPAANLPDSGAQQPAEKVACPAGLKDKLDEAMYKGLTGSVDATLAERGKRYGDFTDHARICWGIKHQLHAAPSWELLSTDKKQALDVIADKIARILSGDPEYRDNWHDIQGYAKLAEDRCKESAS